MNKFESSALNIKEMLTLEQRDNISVLSSLDIGKIPVAEIVLVYLGLKPSTEVSIYEWNEDINNIFIKLEKMGLVVFKKEIKKEKGRLIGDLVVAKDENTAKELMGCNADSEHSEYGKLMGFPQTAIDAFGNEDLLLEEDEYPPEVDKLIFNFKLSKKGYKEEVELMQRWTEVIKAVSPELYQELFS